MSPRKSHSAEFDFLEPFSKAGFSLTVIIHTEATSSFLWFAAIQGIKGK
jgi:hypothetical protein